jgi:hypothetical protein
LAITMTLLASISNAAIAGRSLPLAASARAAVLYPSVQAAL